MTPVSGQETATYRATLPRRAIAKPGVIALGVEVTTADGAKICSRNFKGVVERAVWDAESTQGQDSLTRLEQLIADGDAAITPRQQRHHRREQRGRAANQVIADARITGGNTTTLDPNQPATSSLRGSGLQRVLDLSIPRGAGRHQRRRHHLSPQQARHRQHAAGRKQGRLHAPGRRAPRQQDHRRGREHRQPLPAGGRQHVHRRRGRQEPHPRHPARRADRRRDRPHPRRRHGRHRHRHPGRTGDTTLAFGLPWGARGDPGDPGTPATATTLGVVKPGDNLTVRADGTLDASAGQYELPVASDTTLGGVKVSNSDYTNSRSFPVVTRNGEHLALSFKLGDNAMPDGIGVPRHRKHDHRPEESHQHRALGVVKPDGTTITADTDGTISAFTATASTLMGEGGATMGDALEVAPGIWLCIIRQWVITTQGGYYDAFSFSVYDRAGSRIALAASPTAGTYLILPVAGNAMNKEYNYDTLMGKWVCTTTNTADTAQPDPCTLLLRARPEMGAPAWLTVLVALVSSGGGAVVGLLQTSRPARPHRGIPPPHTERIANATSHQRGATWLTTSSPASSPASLIAAISAIAAGLWHQLKKPALADRRRGDPKVGA